MRCAARGANITRLDIMLDSVSLIGMTRGDIRPAALSSTDPAKQARADRDMLCVEHAPIAAGLNALDLRFAFPESELTAGFEKTGCVGRSAECNDAAVA